MADTGLSNTVALTDYLAPFALDRRIEFVRRSFEKASNCHKKYDDLNLLFCRRKDGALPDYTIGAINISDLGMPELIFSASYSGKTHNIISELNFIKNALSVIPTFSYGELRVYLGQIRNFNGRT